MKSFRLGLAAVGFALLAAACGGADAGPTQAETDEASAREVRTVLTQANEIASDYGRTHLGHYLRFNTSKLVSAGIELPPGVELTVQRTHVTYCIKARTSTLPDTHAWAIATAGPKSPGPSPNDRCSKHRY